jgi:phosphorylase kinase alpha/beta subunit
MWHDDGYYHHKYGNQIPLYGYLAVPQEFLEAGSAALDRLLPGESSGRPYDLAQLSLIWPYAILSEAQALRVLANIEDNLVRDRGVIRYNGDLYFNSNPASPGSNEAEWPLGFAWLSIVYSKMAQRALKAGSIFGVPTDLVERAEMYLKRLEDVMTPEGKVPELYTGSEPNRNVPLAWAQSFYVVAHQSLCRVYESMRRS